MAGSGPRSAAVPAAVAGPPRMQLEARNPEAGPAGRRCTVRVGWAGTHCSPAGSPAASGGGRTSCSPTGGRARRPEARVAVEVVAAPAVGALAVHLMGSGVPSRSTAGSTEASSVEEIHLGDSARAVLAVAEVLLLTVRARGIFVRVGHAGLGSGERVVRRGLVAAAHAAGPVDTHGADAGCACSSSAVVVGRELSHVVAFATVRHGRLGEGTVGGVGVAGGHRARVACCTSLGETVIGVVVIVGERRGSAGSFGGGFCNFAVELLGTTTADGIGNKGDKEDEGDETDDGEDASDGAGVLEEPLRLRRGLSAKR